MKLTRVQQRSRRALGTLFIISVVISILLTAFYNTQITHREQYAMRSEENRHRPVVITAPRGTIFDRNGEVIATSLSGYHLLLIPSSDSVAHKTIRDVAPLIDLTPEEAEAVIKTRDSKPHGMTEIAKSLTFSHVAAVEERKPLSPTL